MIIKCYTRSPLYKNYEDKESTIVWAAQRNIIKTILSISTSYWTPFYDLYIYNYEIMSIISTQQILVKSAQLY